jgi:hypothetical protein
LAALTGLTPAVNAAAGAVAEEAILVPVEAVVVELAAGMVDEGFGAGAATAAVDTGAGTVEPEVDEPAGEAGELRAVASVPPHPLRVNRGSESKTAVGSQYRGRRRTGDLRG